RRWIGAEMGARTGRLSQQVGQESSMMGLHPNTMFEQAFKNIDDALRKEAGCTTELDYTEQTSWLLFLKYLDDLEQDKKTVATLHGQAYAYILAKPYRWDTWA